MLTLERDMDALIAAELDKRFPKMRGSKQPLTAGFLQQLAKLKLKCEIRDYGAPGLGVVVGVTGAMSWILRYRRSGKSAKLTLGPVDLDGRGAKGEPKIGQLLTLAAARQLAHGIHRKRKTGRDPIGERKAEKAAKAIGDRNTFGAAAHGWAEDHVIPNIRRADETLSNLGLRRGAEGLAMVPDGVTARWADRPVAEITSKDLFALLRECRNDGVPGRPKRGRDKSERRARHVFSTLSALFKWAQREQLIWRRDVRRSRGADAWPAGSCRGASGRPATHAHAPSA